MSGDTERLIADALEDAQDGALPPERLRRVRDLLLSDAEARRYYVRLNALNYSLSTQRMAPQTDAATSVGRSRLGLPARRLLAAGMAAALLLAIGWSLLTRPADDAPRRVALLEQLSGDVTVTNANAVSRPIHAGAEVHAGDILRTQGGLGSAVLAYPDGTRLSLAGSTSLTVAGDAQKRIVLHSGILFASVAPQRSPLVVATPRDEVQALGTRFALDASTVETDLSVSEGRVRLKRLLDGRTVEVPAGQRVVSNAASGLVVEAIPATPAEWSENFEVGLPANWEIGEFVSRGLPPGSHGGVRAVRDKASAEGTVAIASQCNWTQGLFAVHDDTHLHFTFKMADPGWFNILLLTRTADDDPPTFAGNHIFDRPLWHGQPNQWAEASIPLASFRPLATVSKDLSESVPFELVFSSPDKDRGLTIDRIWVTRGGSGEAAAVVLDPSPSQE